MLSQIAGSDVYTTTQFREILKNFRECSLTYFHLPRATETIPNLKTIFGENLLQYKVSTYPNLIVFDGNSVSSNRFSLCTVFIFFVEHVELSKKIIRLSNASEERSEFIWYLKQDDIQNQSISYGPLSKSLRPGIYLEIRNFLEVFYICIPCENDSITATVGMPGIPATVNSIRQKWEEVNQNLRLKNIQVLFVPTDPISNYFHSGQSAPYAQYPRRASTFHKSACTMILLRAMKNFTMLVGNVSETNNLQSEVKANQYIVKENVNFWKLYGRMGSVFGVEIVHYAFTTFINKNHLRNRHSEIKQNLIFAPMPWWTWSSLGALGFATSFLLFLEFDKLKGRWSSEGPTLNTFYLLIDQPIPGISWNGQLVKLGLMTVWCAFCLVISNAYRGFIFSCLTNPIKAVVPETLSELMESGIEMWTTDFCTNGSDPTKWSTLRDLMLPEIMSGSKTLGNIYSNLRSSVQQINPYLVDLSVQAVTNKSFPNKFAQIDPLWIINRTQALFQDAGGYWMSKPITEPILINRLIWVVITTICIQYGRRH